MENADGSFLKQLALLIDEAALEAVEKKSDELKTVVASRNLISDQLSAVVLNAESLNRELANSCDKYLSLEKLHNDVVSELHVAKSEESRLSQELSDLRSDIDSRHLKLMSDFALKVAELENEKRDRASGVRREQSLEVELTELKGELAELKRDRDVQARQKGEKEQRIEELSKQIEQVSASLNNKEMEVKSLLKQSDLISLQFHQIQEELKTLSFAKREGDAELDELKKRLQRVTESLTQKEYQFQDAAEKADLILLQLHQAQDELKYYFLLSRRQAKIISSSENLSKRAVSLISKMGG